MATYPARRVSPNSQDWREINEIQTLLCYALNPCCLFLGAPWELDLEPCDLSEIIDRLETALGEAMFEQAWRDFRKVAEA